MIAQKTIAVLPVTETSVWLSQQHRAKGGTELAEVMQDDKKRCCLVTSMTSCQRSLSYQARRYRTYIQHVPKGRVLAPVDRFAGPLADLFRCHFLEQPYETLVKMTAAPRFGFGPHP